MMANFEFETPAVAVRNTLPRPTCLCSGHSVNKPQVPDRERLTEAAHVAHGFDIDAFRNGETLTENPLEGSAPAYVVWRGDRAEAMPDALRVAASATRETAGSVDTASVSRYHRLQELAFMAIHPIRARRLAKLMGHLREDLLSDAERYGELADEAAAAWQRSAER